MATVHDVSAETIQHTLQEWGEPAFRARQVISQLWRRGATWQEMTDLPIALRDRLEAEFPTNVDVVAERVADGNATIKGLLKLGEGHLVEAVLMGYRSHTTVCISSQVGCAMACTFCATGTMGLIANLTPGEMVSQVVWAMRKAEGLSDETSQRLTHIVFMGMGEPLSNYRSVSEAIDRITAPDGLNIGARRITVSTVGIVPNIKRLARDHPQVGLALSLHAADDRLRSSLVPANDLWPLKELVAAVEEWRDVTGRRLSIEWTLMDGVNDTEEQATALARIAKRVNAHVNLIPMNVVKGIEYTPPAQRRIDRFVARLRGGGVNATVRDTRGADIDAACGQLRLTELKGPSRLRDRGDAEHLRLHAKRPDPKARPLELVRSVFT